jgi:hypothetical protein
MAPKIITFQKPGLQAAAMPLPTIRDVAGRYHGRDVPNAIHVETHDALVAVKGMGEAGMPKAELVAQLRKEYLRYGISRPVEAQRSFVDLLMTEKGYFTEDERGNLKLTESGKQMLEKQGIEAH